MTRKEWIEKNLPSYINDHADGGVIGCPTSYNELVRIDPSVRTNKPCKGCHDMTPFVCELCWNTKLNVKEERIHPSDKVEIQKTMGEPHIKDVFYTIVRYPIGKYYLYLVGEFSIISMTARNDTMVKCVSFDYDFQYEYTFFYDLVNKVVFFTPDIQSQAKTTPNLDRSLFLERRDAIEALEKWTGNVVDKSYYFLKQKG
jgi:hypothetical protein